MRYEGYESQERQDDILDKISKYGVDSITALEKEFLDSHSSHREDEIHNKIKYLENDQVFEDDAGYFKFEYQSTEDYGDEIHHIGTLYVPSIEWENGEIAEGILEGKIIVYPNGDTVADFEKVYKNSTYDVFEFCGGIEYELDNFLDYVCEELKEK